MMKNSDVEPVALRDLDIDEKIGDHILGWKVQALGLIIIFLIVLLAALGLFGNGILSKQELSTPDGIASFDRFSRFESRMPLKIRILSTSSNESQIAFSNHYLEKFRIETIVPEPSRVIQKNGDIHYVFENYSNFTVTFYLVPQDFGTITGTLMINDHRVHMSHFIFP
jgi:hypothetical protein